MDRKRIGLWWPLVLGILALTACLLVPVTARADETSYDDPEATAEAIAAFQAVKNSAAYDAVDGAYDRGKAYDPLTYLNDYRSKNGLSALAWDSDLEATALVSARVLSADFSSDDVMDVATPPDGLPAGTSAFRRGVDQGAGDAFGRMTYDGPGNLANADACGGGVACYYYKDEAYWVVEYGCKAGNGQRFASAGSTDGTQKMLRLYNPNSGEHFYTASAYERDVTALAGWNYEGVGWTAPTSSSAPVYRLYNKVGGEHHYTTNAAERDMLVSVGWSYEGIGWYSDDAKSVPLLREYNPNQFSCNHNYTTSQAEHDHLVCLGWRDEGIGWYGVG